MSRMGNKIAFSTLACPDWTLEEAAAAASEYGYDGIEIRVLDGQLLDAAMPRALRARISTAIAAAGIELPVIDTSVKLTADGADVDEDLARWCEIAAECHAPMIRVFGGEPPEGLEWDAAIGRAADRLNRVGPHAQQCGVRLILETHDAFSAAAPVAAIMAHVESPAIGVLWDCNNPHKTGDTPGQAWALLGDRVAHVHVKDTRPNGDGTRTHVLLGEGDVPAREIMALLAEHRYDGWYSVEWEKHWHPEIPGPDVALPHHIELLRSWLSELDGE